MNSPQQAKISDSGCEAQVVNPYRFKYLGGNKCETHIPAYYDFERNNPPLKLTQCRPDLAGKVVNLIEVWQYQLRGQRGWITPAGYSKETFNEWADIMYSMHDASTRRCFEVVSEEESKLPSVVARADNSLEEAAEKYVQGSPEIFQDAYNGFIDGANHIIQSGEYVLKSDVIAILQKEIDTVGNDLVIICLQDALNEVLELKNNK